VGLLVPALPSNRAIMYGNATNLLFSAALFDSNSGTQLTGSTAHALPASPTEIISAATNNLEAEWIRIHVMSMSTSATNTDALLNIYIGGAGSETLFIDSLSAGWSPTPAAVGLPCVYWFPVRIPRGTRISGSLRSLIASDTVRVLVEVGVSNGAHWVGSGVETLGETTASSRGTAVTPSTTGSGWVSMGTSARRYRYVQVGVQGNNDTTLLDGYLNWHVGTGSALLQRLGGMPSRTDAAEAHEFAQNGRWCDIASGTALQLNCYSSAAPSGNVFATLHGVY
jgi:hypothetical protein